MINNRQNGRRRGRGGGPRSPGGVPGAGRQDNRSRGNASQLHEKYKALARDAQLAGDRVQTEYYLQFADHYFRVLNENRARFEEQRRPRDDFGSYEDEDQVEAAATTDTDERDEGEPQAERREERTPRSERADRQERAEYGERSERADREPRDGGEPRPRRSRTRRERVAVQEEAEERIALDSLPPAIAAAPVVEEAEPVKTPRRRTTRRTKAAEGDEIAPAA